QQEKADDFVIGRGESHSVEEFVESAFSYAGLDWKRHVRIDPHYFRPKDVDNLIADSRKAKNLLGWNPKIDFGKLIKIMVDADMRKAGLKPVGEGDEILKKEFPERWWKKD
ncbi:MAG: GDP-mannose 4,6-dehydratase, partial [Candidatus Omnitrophica bacterium]|nr:GDP-mannose 4,6-dehydratase [Candidatus Omnitrophota bacterium]